MSNIHLLITRKPFCIALCNGELFSYGENSKSIADERKINDDFFSFELP